MSRINELGLAHPAVPKDGYSAIQRLWDQLERCTVPAQPAALEALGEWLTRGGDDAGLLTAIRAVVAECRDIPLTGKALHAAAKEVFEDMRAKNAVESAFD